MGKIDNWRSSFSSSFQSKKLLIFHSLHSSSSISAFQMSFFFHHMPSSVRLQPSIANGSDWRLFLLISSQNVYPRFAFWKNLGATTKYFEIMDVKGTLYTRREPLGSPVYLGVMLCSVAQLKQANVSNVFHIWVLQIAPQAEGGKQVCYNLVYLADFFCGWVVSIRYDNDSLVWIKVLSEKKQTGRFLLAVSQHFPCTVFPSKISFCTYHQFQNWL